MSKKKKCALVIGNGAYPGSAKLKNPKHDAGDLSERLKLFGFEVQELFDCTHIEMDAALKSFKATLRTSEIGLFFFAGHGMQIDGVNYLAPVDCDTVDEIQAKHSSLSLNLIIDTMERSPISTSVVVLDACRNNPFERAWGRSLAGRGLAPVFAPKGTLIAYATSPGQVASDGRGRNGAYTEALLEHIGTADCTIETMFKRVRNTLSTATGAKQISWEHTSLASEFFFNVSLGVRIDEYSTEALKDGLLILDDARASHRIIRELKVATWDRQNAAMAEFKADAASKFTRSSLFLIGRNIYQAACGHARSARSYIDNFADKTQPFSAEKRKALLDGILFEIFFDPNAELRTTFKTEYFAEVFDLQRLPRFASSFDFVAECLITHEQRFHAIPGKRHAVAVDVKVEQKGGYANAIVHVYLGGRNVLWLEDDDFADKDGEPARYKKIGRDAFELQLAEEMLVPQHLLKVSYAGRKSTSESLNYPVGWSTRKVAV